MSHRDQRTKRGIRWVAGPRLAFLVLLIGVAGEPGAVGDLLLTETSALTYGAKRGREALGVAAPLLLSRFVPTGHLLSVVKVEPRYGLIGMA